MSKAEKWIVRLGFLIAALCIAGILASPPAAVDAQDELATHSKR